MGTILYFVVLCIIYIIINKPTREQKMHRRYLETKYETENQIEEMTRANNKKNLKK